MIFYQETFSKPINCFLKTSYNLTIKLLKKNGFFNYFFKFLIFFNSLRDKYYLKLLSGPSEVEHSRLNDWKFDIYFKTDNLLTISPQELIVEKITDNILEFEPLTPVDKQLTIWKQTIEDICMAMFMDFTTDFENFEKIFVEKSFLPILNKEFDCLKDTITLKLNDLENIVNYEINPVVIGLTKQKLIINEVKILSNNYEYFNDSTIDYYGLSKKNYSLLFEEILYLNDWYYNKSIHENLGKKIEVSFGKYKLTNNKVHSNLLDIYYLNSKLGTPVEKENVEDFLRNFRVLQDYLNTEFENFEKIINEGIAVIIDYFNSSKFEILDIFEELISVLFENWNKNLIYFLNHDDLVNEINFDYLISRYSNLPTEMIEKIKLNLIEKIDPVPKSHRWENFKKFYKIKEVAINSRYKFNELVPNLKLTHIMKDYLLRKIELLKFDSFKKLNDLRALSKINFMENEITENSEKLKRFSKFNQ